VQKKHRYVRFLPLVVVTEKIVHILMFISARTLSFVCNLQEVIAHLGQKYLFLGITKIDKRNY